MATDVKDGNPRVRARLEPHRTGTRVPVRAWSSAWGAGAVVGASGCVQQSNRARGERNRCHAAPASWCGRGASPSRTSCAMISTATTEPACVSLSATAAFSPAVPVAPPPRRALAPGTAKACTVPSTGPARGSPLSHGRAGHASIAKLQITSLGQSTSLYHCAHVMTTVHMPIYCAGSATIYHALEKDEELLLACFCRLIPGASYRIGIASPAACGIGCTRAAQ
jgi:hypothetical protein